MKRLFLRGIFALWLIFALLILLSRLPRAHSTAPLLVGTSQIDTGFSLTLVDTVSDIRANLRLPWGQVIWSNSNCRIAGIAITAFQRQLRMLDFVRARQVRYSFPNGTPERELIRITWSPDGHWLAGWYPVGTAYRIYSADTLTGQLEPLPPDVPVNWRGWIPPARFFYLDADGEVIDYDIAAGQMEHPGINVLQGFTQKGYKLLVVEGGDLRLFDLATRFETRFPNFMSAAMLQRETTFIAPDNAHIAYSAFDPGERLNLISIYHLADGTFSALPSLNTSFQPALVWSPDSTKLAYQAVTPELNRRDDILVVAGRTGDLLHRIPTLAQVDTLWSPDSRYLLIRGRDLRVFDTDTGQTLNWTEHAASHIVRAFWSPDSRTINVLVDQRDNSYDVYAATIANGQFRSPLIYPDMPVNVSYCYPA
jgi:WD40 repeat protein